MPLCFFRFYHISLNNLVKYLFPTDYYTKRLSHHGNVHERRCLSQRAAFCAGAFFLTGRQTDTLTIKQDVLLNKCEFLLFRKKKLV